MIVLSIVLAALSGAPAHVNTGDYWGGYGGSTVVGAEDAARWYTWVETNAASSAKIGPLGVHTLVYSDPNRVEPKDPLYSGSPDRFAHTCGEELVRTSPSYPGQVLTDPASEQLAADWRQQILREGGDFSAVFDDDAVGAAYTLDRPCRYSIDSWIDGETQLIRRMGLPVIYSGLNDFYQHGPAREIALNRVAIGGMMEECYAQLAQPHEVGGWEWIATETTQLRMAGDQKWFLCYGRDLTPAEQAMQSRLYTDASFLLTYDPKSSVLWEYYKTATNAHVMPESQLVPEDPVIARVTSIDQLRRGGAYVREYRACYIDARLHGPCAVAVNPDQFSSVPVSLSAYRRSLRIEGSGTFDGGRVSVIEGDVPSVIGPLQAAIVFR